MKFYIWSTAWYGAETMTLRKIGNNYLEKPEMSAEEGWRRSVVPIV